MTACYTFYDSLHVLDHQDGSQYPYEIIRDFRFTRNGWRNAIPGRARGFDENGNPKYLDGYRTDFASIPGRRSLKRWLEPQKLIRGAFDATIKWAVWVYRKINDVITLIGHFVDRVAYAAVPHDWWYSTRQIPCDMANTYFHEILKAGGVWSGGIMAAAVNLFGCTFYAGYPDDEVRDDRELGRAAMERFIERIPDAVLSSRVPYMELRA